MRRLGLALLFLILIADPAGAGGWRHRKKSRDQQVPPTPGVPDPAKMVTPNGKVVPSWASRQIANSPVPLHGKSWGRRPWAYALNTGSTSSSAYWARMDQLGIGAGPVPGYTNGPPLGNLPSAPMGPDGGPQDRQGFNLGVFPRIPWAYYSD
ncbi:hypothetical protein P12x_001725 [Tundrisphaera lichenicola]|uniref:hypothetical protein n=1 Tax=Tundrisphaera lichenicola TaxID=2029860 RepID=UPI003EBC1D66